MARPLTTAEFLKRIEHLAPMLTVADDFEYVNSTTPAKFYCHDHGEFLSLPKTILHSRSTSCPGCPECRKEAQSMNATLAACSSHEKAKIQADKERKERVRRRNEMRRQGWKMHPWDPKTGEVKPWSV
jgi:hypothetical protein